MKNKLKKESEANSLRNAIQEGIESGIAQDFDPQKNLENLKALKKKDTWVK